MTYQTLCPDHLRNFFIAKLSTKRVQENYTDAARAAGSIRKLKWDFLFTIFPILVCTYLGGEIIVLSKLRPPLLHAGPPRHAGFAWGTYLVQGRAPVAVRSRNDVSPRRYSSSKSNLDSRVAHADPCDFAIDHLHRVLLSNWKYLLFSTLKLCLLK